MIILTGGAGFIGSVLLKKLNDNGIEDILVVDRLGSSDKWKNLVGKKYTGFVHKDDFLEAFSLIEIENIEAIFHLGACTDTTEKDADYLQDNNTHFSIELARIAMENNIRFIYASSAATYGRGEEGYSDSVFDPLKPLNPYGFSKHRFDLWIRQNGFEKSVTGLKFFNVFGPNEYHKGNMASMVYKAYNQIKETGKVKLFKSNHHDYEDGQQMRDFIYVQDVVDIIYQMYMHDITNKGFKPVNGIFNIGTGSARTWNDLASSVFSAMEVDSSIEYIDMPEHLSKQYQNFTEANMTKLSGFIPINIRSLEDSVKDYIQNYLRKDWQYI